MRRPMPYHATLITALLVASAGSILPASAQTSAAPAANAPATAPDPNSIYVDDYCGIHEIVVKQGKPKDHVFSDHGICAVGPEKFSDREETTYVLDKRKRTTVLVREHTFVLHNPRAGRMTFVVSQPVPKGWQVDSAPPPTEVTGTMARFLVAVGPGQTVELHVGERNPPAR